MLKNELWVVKEEAVTVGPSSRYVFPPLVHTSGTGYLSELRRSLSSLGTYLTSLSFSPVMKLFSSFPRPLQRLVFPEPDPSLCSSQAFHTLLLLYPCNNTRDSHPKCDNTPNPLPPDDLLNLPLPLPSSPPRNPSNNFFPSRLSPTINEPM